MAQNMADSPFLEIENHYIIDHPEIKKMIQKNGKQVCGHCLSMNCRLKQLLSMKLELSELQTNLGCEGSPKLTFADVRTEKEKVTSSAPPAETPQPSVAARADG